MARETGRIWCANGECDNATILQCDKRKGRQRRGDRNQTLGDASRLNRRISNQECPITQEKSKRRKHSILGIGSRTASPLMHFRIPDSRTTSWRRVLIRSGQSRHQQLPAATGSHASRLTLHRPAELSDAEHQDRSSDGSGSKAGPAGANRSDDRRASSATWRRVRTLNDRHQPIHFHVLEHLDLATEPVDLDPVDFVM